MEQELITALKKAVTYLKTGFCDEQAIAELAETVKQAEERARTPAVVEIEHKGVVE